MLKFNEFNSKEIAEEIVLQEDASLDSYYLYFVVYRSPEGPNWNIYVGIKHKNTGKSMPAKYFFGTIRYNTNTGRNEIKDTTYFKDCILRVDKSGKINYGPHSMYMTSSGEYKNSDENLSRAFAKGFFDQNKLHHPCIMNSETHDFVDELLKKNLNKNETLSQRIQSVVRNFLSKISDSLKPERKEQKPEVKKEVAKDSKENQDEQEETNESFIFEKIELPKQMNQILFPINEKNFEEDAEEKVKFVTGPQYGYRILVVADMNDYFEELKKLKETVKDLDTAGGSKAVDNMIEKFSEEFEEMQRQIARYVTGGAGGKKGRDYYSLLVQNVSNRSQIPELASKGTYRKFIVEQVDKYKHLAIGLSEKRFIELLQDEKASHQALNSPTAFVDKSSFKYYLPSKISESDEKEIRKVAFPTKEAKDEMKAQIAQGNQTYETLEEILDDAERKRQLKFREISDYKQAVLCFTRDNDFSPEVNRKHGYRKANQTDILTCAWNDDNNLLQKAVNQNDKESISKLKEIFLQYEFPIGYLKHKGAPLFELYFRISKNNKPAFICWTDGQGGSKKKEISALSYDEIDNYYKLHNSKTTLRRENFFTMQDFVKTLGYSASNEKEKLEEFGRRNKLISNELETLLSTSKKENKEKRQLNNSFSSIIDDWSEQQVLTEAEEEKENKMGIQYAMNIIKGELDFKHIFFEDGTSGAIRVEKIDMSELKKRLLNPVVPVGKNVVAFDPSKRKSEKSSEKKSKKRSNTSSNNAVERELERKTIAASVEYDGEDDVLNEKLLPARLLDYQQRVKIIIERVKSGEDLKDCLAIAKRLLGEINVEDKDGELSKEKSQLEAIIQEQEKNKTSAAFAKKPLLRKPLLSFNKFRNK